MIPSTNRPRASLRTCLLDMFWYARLYNNCSWDIGSKTCERPRIRAPTKAIHFRPATEASCLNANRVPARPPQLQAAYAACIE